MGRRTARNHSVIWIGFPAVSMAIVVLALVVSACRGKAESAETSGTPPDKSTVAGTHVPMGSRVTVTYFHTSYRCPTCMLLEKYSRETVEKDFSKELRNGTVVFRVINVDEPENKHFIQDYGLYTKSLVVSETKDGKQVRWKNLPDIWQHVRDKDRFERYVADEIRSYLKGP